MFTQLCVRASWMYEPINNICYRLSQLIKLVHYLEWFWTPVILLPLCLPIENIHFPSLFAAGDVSRRETSATQGQKFHTDDANQCLHNKSGSHGVPNRNLSNFTCLLVNFGKVLCSFANELQRNSNASSREEYISQILSVLLEILRVLTFDLCGLLSFVCHS